MALRRALGREDRRAKLLCTRFLEVPYCHALSADERSPKMGSYLGLVPGAFLYFQQVSGFGPEKTSTARGRDGS